MDAKLVRGPDGNIVFMEADSTLVDRLLAIMRAPIGSLVQEVMSDGSPKTNERVALGGFLTSVRKLPESVWEVSQNDVMPSKWSMEDVRLEKWKPEPSPCVLCVKQYGTQYAAHRCHQKVVCYICGLTKAGCAMSNVCMDCRGGWISDYHTQYNNCVKCVVARNGGSNTIKNNSTCLKCGRFTRACSNCQLCDTCGIFESGYVLERLADLGSVPTIKEKSKSKAQVTASTMCKDTFSFLITNKLHVLENSFIKGVQVMSEAHVTDVESLQHQRIKVLPSDLRSMFRLALCGSSRVLDQTFPKGFPGEPETPHPADDDGESSIMSMNSLNLTNIEVA
mmetsp:Transcript_88644/g.185262  ORF Transcript_88644/g.185262 Transcript_88644/m.185262 type:complete len:336 (-) Transcript_88644:422-1429(-)